MGVATAPLGVHRSPPGSQEARGLLSIRSRLLLLTLLATLLPALLAVTRFLQERQRAIEADTARLVAIAQRRAETLDEKIRGTAQLHFGLARARELLSDDRDACSAFLAEVRDAYPQYTGILTIRPDGALFCDSLRSGRELDLRDRGYFKAALAARGGVVLEPVFGRITGTAVLQIAHPVRSAGGELQFILLASLNLAKLLAVESLSVPEARILLLDRAGTVLASSRSDDPRSRPGTSLAASTLFAFLQQPGRGTATLTGPDDEPGVWAVADQPALAEAGLSLVAGAPRRALLKLANRRLGEDLLLLAGVAAAIFLAVWLVAEVGLRRQIARITRMATGLASGDLTARIAAPLPRGELGALMQVLNQTAQSLQGQRADIEQLNERLRQSQRLEAVGQLTGGVAHDFNNLLTVVLGNAELLAEEARLAPEQRELAEGIVGAARRGAELTHRLLAFARRQTLQPKVVDVNALVRSLEPMLRRTLGEHIEIDLRCAEALWPALVDQGQLENALLNLCLNARDAMPGGGKLTFETQNAALDEACTRRHLEVLPGPYVMVAVSDTGQGIAPEHQGRVFEPFFTTKEKSKGTGLGLAMVYGFVKQSRGHIALYSELGHGTTLKLYLPRPLSFTEAAQETGRTARAAPIGGHETILLVEDDPAVRQYSVEQLRSFGYQVIEAVDGPSALAIIALGADLDLLFTDVVMPGGMNGRALASEALRLRPRLRVLYTSGYTDDAIVHHGTLDPGVQLLSKPYHRADLDSAVRAALA
jgi:signal transduction histidine kinase/CheY-like chemotaxis protein